MKAPFWRSAIISLLLWALPVQWLAAASAAPCAGHPAGVVRAASEPASASLTGTTHHAAPEGALGPGAVLAAHHQVNAHDHGLVANAHAGGNDNTHTNTSNTKAATDAGHDDAPAHSQGMCASAGHCCPSSALVSHPALPDFAQRSALTAFAPLAQHHRAPVLDGPERPPRLHAA